MNLRIVVAVALVCLLGSVVRADIFIPTTGTQSWNVNTNWDTSAFPNSTGASAVIPAATGALTIDLGQPITVGSLAIVKSSGNFTTTIGVGATNTLTIDGGTSTISNGNSTTATGQTIIAAPVVIGPNSTGITISQLGANSFEFNSGISGTGTLTFNRDLNGTAVVALNAANSYSGSTILTGLTGTNYTVVRLNDANAMPGGIGTTGGTSNIVATGSVIIGLSATDFTRGIGTLPHQLSQFNGSNNQGWAAFGQDRAVNFFGDSRSIIWGGSGANFNNLTLGHISADRTIDFQNGLNLSSGGSVGRNIRFEDGTAAIDGKISGVISISGAGAVGDVTFQGGGTGSLTAANTYNGFTQLQNSTTVVLDNAAALPNGNLRLTGNGVLGLGTNNNTFTRALGTAAGQVQFTGGGGFAAFGGNKTVNLGGAVTPTTVIWGSGSFVTTANNLTLATLASSGTLDFQNPIDLGAAQTRIIVVDEGTAAIDAVLSGGVTGTTSGLRKNGDGTLQLITASTYTGQTLINGGSLRLDHASALPAASPLLLQNGGVIGLGIGNDTFTRSLGTGAGQVSTGGTGGGFAAYGGTKIVRLNNDANTTMIWGTPNPFAATQLVLSDGGADGTVDFQNKIDLNSAIRQIQVRNGTAVVDGKISGVISGDAASGITKTNPGTLELNAANTYGGPTQINSGVIVLTNEFAIPGGIAGGNTANIIISGTNSNTIPVLGLGHSNFTSNIGTAAGQINLGTHSGFAAYFGNRSVNLGGASQQVQWGIGGFVTGFLQLSSTESDGTLDFQNPIDLNSGARTIKTPNGTAVVDGLVSGVISGSGSSLSKDGGGTLKLAAANTYDGGTTIVQGTLLVSNTSGSGTGSGTVAVNSGTLGGTGSISGAVTVASGAHIAPGESIESLDVGALVLNAGSILDFELGAPGSPGITSDLLNVTDSGGLTLNGGSVALTDAGGLAAGTYTLIDYAGALNGSVAALGTPTGPGGFTYALANNVGNTSIDLQVTAVVVGVPGDFNSDGKVDAGDYVTWRKNDGSNNALANDGGLGTPVRPAHYDLWRANFGNPPGAGSGDSLSGGAVPEPTALILLALSTPLIVLRRSR